MSIWDDHEVEDNYADLDDSQDDLPYAQRHQTRQEFAIQHAHAYQAWYEHTPIRASYLPGSSDLRIYRRLDFGTRFVNPPPASLVNLDQWDGYAPQRARLLSAVRASGATNPIVLAGDIHSTWVSDLKLNFDDATSPVVATEFVSTSITSDFPAELLPVAEESNRAFNPWLRYFNGRTHGWLHMEVDRACWLTEERSVATVDSPDAPASTTARWLVEAGRPGVVPA